MATTQRFTSPQEAGAKRLEGRVAIVTGGNRGIGAAICRSLAADGAAIAAGYSRNRDQAEEFRKEIEGMGVQASVHQGNVGSPEDCERVIGEVLNQHGQIDILVNNAGITADKVVAKMTVEDWRSVIQVNLSGTFYMAQFALENMLERGTGRIVNISSVIGQTGNIGQANYAAAKSGIHGLTWTLAKEAAWALGKAGKLTEEGPSLTVNAIAPGYIATDMVSAVPEKVLDKIKAQIPLRRLGRAEEIARVVHFLCDDDSSYITGQVWGVNGGMEMSGAS